MAAMNESNSMAKPCIGNALKEECFYAALFIEKTLSNQFCETILIDRLQLAYSLDPSAETLSIATSLKTRAYQQALDINIKSWPDEYKSLEKSAIQRFGHWAQFWCEYEIFKIKQGYPYEADHRPRSLSLSEENYHSEFIERIESVDTPYQTLHHEVPVTLSDAIVLINLSTLVLHSQWYEILLNLDLSRQGSHFLMTTTNDYPYLNKAKTIVSSARVQNWQESENWLYFTPFFRNHHWQLCLPNNLNQRCLELELFDSTFHFEGHCNQSFEDRFSAHILDKTFVCEVLRLTVSGSNTQGAFFLFLAQKKLMRYLMNKNIKLAYTIIEQPWMIHFYETLRQGGYLPSSFRNIDHSDRHTYKGFWVIPNLCNELENTNFHSYKRRVVSRIKQMKEINYV
ncbi:acyl-homoserine-lactone synthase [Vibrio sp. YMD68]|uniref:acyl-homoserine-lactone synthase n=1 Tax=Vibrio sp. YMD68 TaxID=3042300 RepID=UPI00249B81C7|nr:acyl-homoserine-lactone synthase [Vibrio sp. YMD68]WGW01598.1 acyl-homoserine-lactone synthase [Vibrio sp. YMD68]